MLFAYMSSDLRHASRLPGDGPPSSSYVLRLHGPYLDAPLTRTFLDAYICVTIWHDPSALRGRTGAYCHTTCVTDCFLALQSHLLVKAHVHVRRVKSWVTPGVGFG